MIANAVWIYWTDKVCSFVQSLELELRNYATEEDFEFSCKLGDGQGTSVSVSGRGPNSLGKSTIWFTLMTHHAYESCELALRRKDGLLVATARLERKYIVVHKIEDLDPGMYRFTLLFS